MGVPLSDGALQSTNTSLPITVVVGWVGIEGTVAQRIAIGLL